MISPDGSPKATCNPQITTVNNLNPLSIEFARLDRLFAMYLSKLRHGGRSTLGDVVGGAVIEDGEAEGLLNSLYDTHTNLANAEEPEQWKSPLPALERAQQIFKLSHIERDILLLALSVEVDSRYARLVAYLNDHVAMTRPTLGLAVTMLAPDNDRTRAALIQKFVANSTIRRYGLIQLEGDGPIANRSMFVPETFWPRLIGLNSQARYNAKHCSVDSTNLVLNETTHKQIQIVSGWLKTQKKENLLVIIVGDEGTGRDSVAEVVARELANTCIMFDARHDNPVENISEVACECRWHNAVAIFRHAEVIPDDFHKTLQWQLESPIIYITEPPHDGRLLDLATRPCTELLIPAINGINRIQLWNHLSQKHDLKLNSSALANRFGFGPGRIDKALMLSSTIANTIEHEDLEQEVQNICNKMQHAQFNELAQKLLCPFDVTDIVLPDKTRDELDLICTWAQHGNQIFNDEGLGRSLNTGKGLVCLFSGLPGTGKTMAAQVIAKRIGFDIYRIDLSQVVNKYVGETEKNLAKVFDEAQRSKVILFFDEAEALYGDRSEVKTAQDRFANIEIGYLLQRIETFEGVAILATNLQKNLDEAFTRRISVIADFPIPDATERKLIWHKLLPTKDECAEDIDVDLLARQFKIAGGDIRNAIFSALLLAADEQAQLGMPHLVRGLWRELQKSGRMVDASQFGVWREYINRRN